MIELLGLKEKYNDSDVSYQDVVNYEICRENICSYMFFLQRQKNSAINPKAKQLIENKIQRLIEYREELQIADKYNVQRVLKELIPEYKAEIEKTIH